MKSLTGMLTLLIALLVASFVRAQSTNTATIQWDRNSLRQVSSSIPGEWYHGYPRLIQLSDGSLRCVYEANGKVVVVSSNGTGDSWSEPITVAEKEPNLCMAVPEILQLGDGSLLVSYNVRPCPPGDGRRFAIRTKKSYDGGMTWSDESVAYKAGEQPEVGCWEPAAVQMPDGEIRLFFADESRYSETNEQNISRVCSTDGGLTWSQAEIASFREGFRDGMPSPLLLNSGELVIAIEDNGSGNFKPFIVRETGRHPALANRLETHLYAGAPCIRQLSTGETLLSYQGTESRRNEGHQFAAMRVAVGDSDARHFKNVTVPFDIPADGCGLWNSLAVLEDDTIVALTSTNAWTPGSIEVWMIKGRLVDAKQ